MNFSATNNSGETADNAFDALTGLCQAYNQYNGLVTIVLSAIAIPLDVLFCRVLLSRSVRNTISSVLLSVSAMCDICLMCAHTLSTVRKVYGPQPENNYTWALFYMVATRFSVTINAVGQYTMILLIVDWLSRISTTRRSRPFSLKRRLIVYAIIVTVIPLVTSIPLYVNSVLQIVPRQHNETFDTYKVQPRSRPLMKIIFWLLGVNFKLIPCTIALLSTPLVVYKMVNFDRNHRRLIQLSSQYSASVAASAMNSCSPELSARNTTTGPASASLTVPNRQGCERKATLNLAVYHAHPTRTFVLPGDDISNRPSARRFNAVARNARLLTAVATIFVVTQLPIAAITMGIAFAPSVLKIYKHCGSFLDLITMLNGAINFAIYCSMNAAFRIRLKALFGLTDNRNLPVLITN